MPDPSNSSFIPKRGPAKKSRAAVTKRVYLFTIISYVLLFSALLASGGMYFYKGVVQEALNEEVAILNQQINTFSESNMQRVLEFNSRLEQTRSRLEVGVSIPSLLVALEESTVQTVKFKSLALEREDDTRLVVEGEMETDTFDSTLFQRRLYQTNQTIGTIEVAEFNASNIEGRIAGDNQNTVDPSLTFSVILDFPLSNIPFDPARARSMMTTFDGLINSSTDEVDAIESSVPSNNTSI